MTCCRLFNYVQTVCWQRSRAAIIPECEPERPGHAASIWFQGIIRSSCRRLKYPSSYPDFRMHPFFTITLSLPEKRRLRSSFSVAAESSSASLILRRNSANVLSSTLGSVSVIASFTSARTTEPGNTSNVA
jgi:hypothetical protein